MIDPVSLYKKKAGPFVKLLLTLIGMILIMWIVWGWVRPKFSSTVKEALVHSRGEQLSVKLFFLSEDGRFLAPEKRPITVADTDGFEEQIKKTIQELILGPKSKLNPVLSPQAKLLNVFITKNGQLYLNFGKDFEEIRGRSIRGEWMSATAVAVTIQRNFTAVKKVWLLSNGQLSEDIFSHINGSLPCGQETSLILR